MGRVAEPRPPFQYAFCCSQQKSKVSILGFCQGGGGGTSIVRRHGDVPLIRVYFSESFSQTRCLFSKLLQFSPKQEVHFGSFPPKQCIPFDFLTKKTFIFDILLSQNNENL